MRKRKLFPVVLVALLGLAFASAPAGAHPAGEEHLPDLRTLKPSEMRVSQSCTLILLFNCKRQLRFSNTIGNYGHGRLEMRPENDLAAAKTIAHQRIYSHDAAGRWYLKREVAVGEFAFHPNHAHWHFEAFADYRLITASASDTTIGGTEVRSSQKVTFCIIDTDWLGTTLEHAGSQTYTRCGPTDVTGLTVGWGDKYGSSLPGQEFDLAGLADGFYWLKSTADPDQRLEETDESNNCAAAKIEIRGSSVYDRGQKIPC
ncbi:MAG TPA: lysyl oxidase family protein [Solirubrobacteraceae bacterium]|nr:lysyl oxidase family protein [Solirubrobacteraceae bacterium]